MPLAPATNFDCRTTGSDTNGGGFCPGSGGTDFSQQPAAQFSFSDLASTNGSGANPVVTSASHNFAAADVANCLNIPTTTSGWTSGVYQIVSVAANAATLDRPCGTVAALNSGVWKEGGAFATPGFMTAVMNNTSGGGIGYLQSGTYVVTTATANVANGCLSLPPGTLGVTAQLYGYGTVHGDNAVRPIIGASGISTYTLVAAGANHHVQGLILLGNNLASGTGFKPTGAGRIVGCRLSGFSLSLSLGVSPNAEAIACEVVNNSGVGQAATGGSFYGCTFHDNMGTGCSLSNTGSQAVDCVSAHNSGTASDGFSTVGSAQDLINCAAAGNGRHGFNVTPGSVPQNLINCISTDHASGYGFAATVSGDGVWLLNCFGWNNSGQGDVNNTTIQSGNTPGFVSLTASPWNNMSGNDFGVNNLPGGGQLVRGGGVPTSSGLYSLPGLSTLASPDAGPAQHPTPASIPGVVSLGGGNKLGGNLQT